MRLDSRVVWEGDRGLEARPPPSPRVSVVIPAFNAADTLAVQLDAFTRQLFDAPWELILVDNGSKDGTVALAHSYEARLPLRIVEASEVRGPAYARNVGARAASAPYLAFADADDEVDEGWLAAVTAALDEHSVVASRFGTEKLNTPEVRATRRLAQEHGLGAHAYASFLPHASTSGLCVHRALHEAIGGFDEQLRALEDTDYCFRLQLAGHAIHFEPAALVHYRLRSNLAASIQQSFGYGRYNGYLYVRYRHLGMAHVPLSRDLRCIARLTVKSIERLEPSARARRLRSLANRLGVVVGRVHGSLLGAHHRWKVAQPRPAVSSTRPAPRES